MLLFSSTIFTNVLLIVAIVAFGAAIALGVVFILQMRAIHKKGVFSYPPDSVTGLINLEQFKAEVKSKLSTAKPGEYSLISVDIDNFKHINNAFNFETGNDVLRWFASIITENSNVIATRNYADEFLIFVKSLGDDPSDIVNKNCAKLKEESESYKKMDAMLGGNYSLHLSIGYYEIVDPRESFERMLDSATLAKKTSKEVYGTCLTKYDISMLLLQNAQKEIIQAMEKALYDEEFVPFIQPKFSLKERALIGAEALARWVNPRRGTMTPISFIPLFEKNGFIVKLDLYMMKKTCMLIEKWKEQGKKIPVVSINFSRITLVSDGIVEKIKEIAEAHSVAPQQLEIELTESVIIENFSTITEVVSRIKDNGFSVSMDDFGSGYSSLNKLKDLPVDVLKIDKAFLNESINTEKGKKIIGSVIAMSKILGLSTVAEGVETQEQADSLLELGCDNAQGFLFAPPLQSEEFEKLLS